MMDDTRNVVGSATTVTVLKMETNKLFRLGNVPDPPSVGVRQARQNVFDIPLYSEKTNWNRKK